MPVSFGDFTNAVTDLFKLDVDNKVKMTTKTKEGVLGGDPAKVVLALKNGAPKLSCKWKNDTVEVGTADYDYKKNSLNIETTFASVPSVPGLSVDVNMSKPLGGDKAAEFPIELTYESGDMLNAGLSCTAPAFDEFTGSCTLYTDGLTVGAALTGSPSEVKDFPISLSYGTGPYYGAVEATNKMGTFTVLSSYKPTKELTLGCSYMFPEEQKQCYKMAAVYKPAGDPYSSKVAGMVSFEQSAKIKTGAHLLNLSYTGVPTKGVSIEAKCSAPVADLAKMSGLKYGLGLTFG